MDQFDDIIKEKINNKSYNYTPQAWRSFKRQSGMPVLGIGAKLALTAVSVTIVGIGLYFIMSQKPETPESSTLVTEKQSTDSQQIDTIAWAENVVSEDVSEETVASACPTLVSSPSTPKPQNNQLKEESPAEKTESDISRQPRHITKTIYYRPTEILVDTISSIDFPNYESKPADMLP